MSKGRRPARIGAAIRTTIAEALMGELKDPALAAAPLLSVTSVDVTGDLSIATIYVAGTFADDAAADQALAGLTRAAPRLRALLGQRLRVRRVPELRFRLDESIAHGRRIEQILEELRTDDPKDEP